MKSLNGNISFLKCDIILVGKIIMPHGLKGILKIKNYSVSNYNNIATIILYDEKNALYFNKNLAWIKPCSKETYYYARIEGINTRTKAELFLGYHIYIEKKFLCSVSDESDTYFWSDIIGLEVYSFDNEKIGSIDSIIATGSNDVYVIKTEKKNLSKEILIPAIKSVILNIDLFKRKITVKIPKGLE